MANYDPGFPLGDDYTVSFSKQNIDGKAIIDEGSVEIRKDGELVTGHLEVKDDRITLTKDDGSQLVLTADTSLPNSITNAGLDLRGVGGMKIQVGASEGQEINIAIPKISLVNMGLNGIDVRTTEGARKAMDQTELALSFTSSVRARLGAYENRFEKVISNLDVSTENLTKSYSTIKDVDMADEMVEYTTLQVLVQAGTSMLSQANEQPQQALQLLQ